MKTRSVVALLAAAGLVAVASARTIITPGITANLDLSRQQDPVFPHNDNGLLEPGEHALILTSISFTGQFTLVQLSPGNFYQGMILGLAIACIDLRSTSGDSAGLYNGGITSPPSSSVGPNANSAGTAGYGVRGGWLGGGNVCNGNLVANGFADINPYQFPPDPSQCNTTNPIGNIERLGWTPSSYAARTVTFGVSAAAGAGFNVLALYLDLNGSVGHPGTLGGAGYLPLASIHYGSIDVPVAPAPAGLAPLVICGLAMPRRRGRAHGEGVASSCASGEPRAVGR